MDANRIFTINEEVAVAKMMIYFYSWKIYVTVILPSLKDNITHNNSKK